MEQVNLVQVDTLDVRPLPGVILKHFTAMEVVSRWDVVEVRTRATANTATDFLSTLLARMPFPVRAIQVDGGSEFQAGFEQACQERGLRLFVLPPRSPKLNGAVERAQHTHTFGDGQGANFISGDHAYADDGVYTVTLEVTDSLVTSDTVTHTITITNEAPRLSASWQSEVDPVSWTG